MATGDQQRDAPAATEHEPAGNPHGEHGGGAGTAEAATRYPQRDLLPDEVVVGTGRISVARRVTPILPTLPFTRWQLARIDDALTEYTRSTGLRFSVYLGDLGPDTRARADELVDSLGAQAADAVLVAVSPGQRVVEVVTGARARQRLTDQGCKLAVTSMVALFEKGDLADGITAGLRTLAEQTATR